MKTTHCAAIDLGATSGRVIVGSYNGEQLALNEVHRFANGFHSLGKHDYWNIGGLFAEIREGLRKAKAAFPELVSCGVDTWGSDHALLNHKGRLVYPIHAYRDMRTEPLFKKLKGSNAEKQLYEWTGIPAINYNTTMQLSESLTDCPSLREAVDRVLLLPDYFNYLLSGAMANEVSIASTGQLLALDRLDYSREALDYFGIPESWFDKPTCAGRKLGKVNAVEGLEDVEVVLVPGHDTSCAFEANPRTGNDLLISAGTWLLTGALTSQPAQGEGALQLGISNERAGHGGYRPNRILLGLWLLERVMDALARKPKTEEDWARLIEEAAELSAPKTLIDTNDRQLFNPADMAVAIRQNLKAQGAGQLPETLADYMRLICDSLGRSVAATAEQFGKLSGTQFDNISIVGGGSKNSLLCQRIADFSGLPVSSYSLEGTAVGNIGYQLLGLKAIDHLDTYREVVANGTSKHVYQPRT